MMHRVPSATRVSDAVVRRGNSGHGSSAALSALAQPAGRGASGHGGQALAFLSSGNPSATALSAHGEENCLIVYNRWLLFSRAADGEG